MDLDQAVTEYRAALDEEAAAKLAMEEVMVAQRESEASFQEWRKKISSRMSVAASRLKKAEQAVISAARAGR